MFWPAGAAGELYLSNGVGTTMVDRNRHRAFALSQLGTERISAIRTFLERLSGRTWTAWPGDRLAAE